VAVGSVCLVVFFSMRCAAKKFASFFSGLFSSDPRVFCWQYFGLRMSLPFLVVVRAYLYFFPNHLMPLLD